MGARWRGCVICVRVALLIQHTTRILALFRHYPINDMILGKQLLNIKCVFFSTTFFGTFLIGRRIRRDIVINVETSSCKVPLFLSGLNET